jgi:hypothetical protein
MHRAAGLVYEWEPRSDHNPCVQTAIRSVQRRWQGSIGFRLAAWSTAVLFLAAIASISYQTAVVLGAILVAVALNYHLLVAWVVIKVGRTLRRSISGWLTRMDR